MIFVIAIIGFTGLLIALILLLPDLSRFVWRKTGEIKYPNKFVDFSSIGITIFVTAVIAGIALFLYKFCTALVAYCLSDGLISFFISLRGVFSIVNEPQDPFAFNHLLSGLILTPAVQLLSVYFIYDAIRKFMIEKNKMLENSSSDIYNERDAFYFGLITVVIFILYDLVLYSQTIPPTSQIAHLVFLGLSKIATVIFFLAISHVKLLKDQYYSQSISKYLEIKPKAKAVIFTPWRTILITYLIALVLHFPFFTGIQFIENNWLIGLILIIACAAGYYLLRLFLSEGFNYLGVIMLLEGPVVLRPAEKILEPNKQKVFIYLIGATGILFFLFKLKLLFFSASLLLLVFLVPLLLSFILTYFTALSLSIIRAKIKGFSRPESHKQAIISYLYNAAKSLLRGVALMVGVIFLIFSFLTFLPKPFEYKDDALINAVFDKEGNLIYQDYHDGNPSIPISYSDIKSSFLLKCLTLQEDRKFFQQDNWLPNLSNWHGFSMAIFYRYFLGGGGSNINQQLVKNAAFNGIFPRDVQRKLAELLTAYQLSIQCNPEKIITSYLNAVSFHGGRGHKGIQKGSLAAFGKSFNQLNNLELMYLVSTLKRGTSFKTESGYLDYSELAYHHEEVKATLIAKAERWFNAGLLSKKELYKLKNQELRFDVINEDSFCATSTKEFVRKKIERYEHSFGTYRSSLTRQNQKKIQQAVNAYNRKFKAKLTLEGCQLTFAAIVVNIKTGHIIGHYGGEGSTDLTSLGSGYPIGSVIKPFLLVELLEKGWEFDEVRLYDGSIPGKFTPKNYSKTYSNKRVGINTILGKSLNAPMVNIRELIDPISLFGSVENKFTEMGIPADPYTNLNDAHSYGEHEVNYPLGSRSMTLFDLAQAYQTLMNNGMYKELTILQSYTSPFIDSGEKVYLGKKSRKVYQKDNARAIKRALQYSMKPGGTGTHILNLLPSGKHYYAKTGTTDKAKHGYTVLSDGENLIVSWASYCSKDYEDHLECNDTPGIPHGSGVRSAGVLAALIYKHFNNI